MSASLSPIAPPALSENGIRALEWARSGLPVFPCRSGSEPVRPGRGVKTPLVNWQSQATTDEAVIRAWWERWPAALIGVRPIGLVVIDCDRKGDIDGVSAWDELGQMHGFDGEPAMIVGTPSGGEHHIFRAPPGQVFTNSTGGLPSGIDVRAGTAGYIIAEGSVLPDGRAYRRRAGPSLREGASLLALAELPASIGTIIRTPRRDAATTQAEAIPAPHPRKVIPALQSWADLDLTHVRAWTGMPDEYVMWRARGSALLDKCTDELASVLEGERGKRSNDIAYRVGRWVGSGAVDEDDACEQLLDACHRNGLAAKDGVLAVQRAIEKALRDGERSPADLPPLTCPEPPQPPQAPPPGRGRFARAMHRIDDGDPLEAPCYVVEPFIHERTVSVLVGKWGLSKSFLVIDWCVRLAAGLPIAGRLPEVSGAAYYFAGEGQDALRKRFHAVKRHLGVRGDIPARYIPALPDLCNPEDVSELIADLRHHANQTGIATALVVFDTFSRSLGGRPETLAENLLPALRAAERVRTELGCAVLFVHHPPRNNDPGAASDVKNRAAGPKNIEADVDAVLLLSRQEDVLRLTASKVKDGPDDGVIAYRTRLVELGVARNPRANGRPVTSLVIDYIDPATVQAPSPQAKRPSAKDRALQTIATIMAGPHGLAHVLSDGSAVRAIEAGELRQAMEDAAERAGEERATGWKRVRDAEREGRLHRDGTLLYQPPEGAEAS